MEFFLAGGFPMVLIAVFGVIGLVGAVRFAVSPRLVGLLHLGVSCIAITSAGIAGVAADLRAVSMRVAETPEWQGADLPLVLVVGFGEAMTPAILSLSVVACVALIASLGVRRLPLGV